MDQASNPFQPPAADIRPPQAKAGGGALLVTPRRVSFARALGWFKLSYRLFMTRKGLLFGGSLLALLPIFAFSMALHTLLGGAFPGVELLMNLFTNWISLCLLGGFMVIVGRVDRGAETGISDLLSVFQSDGGKLFIAAAVYMMVLAAFNLLVGILFMPLGAHPLMGLSPAAMMDTYANMSPLSVILVSNVVMLTGVIAYFTIWFVPALVAHHRLSALALVRLSALACLRNIPAILLFGILTVIFAILATLPLLLGWLLFLPVVMVTQYVAYRDLLTDASGDPQAQTPASDLGGSEATVGT